MKRFTESLQVYFEKQTKTVRLIIAIAIPLLLFIIALSIAQSITSSVMYARTRMSIEYSEPFDLSKTGLIWFIFVSIVSYLEYCIWQPTKKDIS